MSKTHFSKVQAQRLCLFCAALLGLILVQQVRAHNAADRPLHQSFQESPLSPLAAPDAAGAAANAPKPAADNASSGNGDQQPQAAANAAPGPITAVDRPITSGNAGDQTSLILVGAVLVGMIVVAGLAIWRRS